MRKKPCTAVKALGLAVSLLAGSPVAALAELSVAALTETETLLAQLNFDPGPIDGVVDARTRAAIRLYQEFAALPPDGQPSPALLHELRQVARAFDDLKSAQIEAPPGPVAPVDPEATAAPPRPKRKPPAKVAVAIPGPVAPKAASIPKKPAPGAAGPKKAVRAPGPETAWVFDIDGMIARLAKARLAKARGRPRPAPSKITPDRAADTRTHWVEPPWGNGYDAFRSGYAAARAGDLDRAIEFYSGAITSGDLSLEHLAFAFYNRANAYLEQAEFDHAIADYNAATLNKPDLAGAYHNRGFAHHTKGEKRLAEHNFRKGRDLGVQRLDVRSRDALPPFP